MKALICQLCQKEITDKELFHHLVEAHQWKVNINRESKSDSKDASGKTNKTSRKRKGLWQKSPELLTCPHCEQRYKRKQMLIDHLPKCIGKRSKSDTKKTSQTTRFHMTGLANKN